MQQRLAVASVLLLGLLSGASVFMIQSHAYGPAQPQANAASQSSQTASATTTTHTNSTSTSTNPTSASLLTAVTTHTSRYDD